MADFVTRLAERTMGAAPIVRPVIAPKFAPEPDGLRTAHTQGDEPDLTTHRFGQAPPTSDAPVPDHTAALQDDADGTTPARRTEKGPRPSVDPAPPERDSDPGPTRRGAIPDVTDRPQRGRLARTDPPDLDAGFEREDLVDAFRLVPEPARSASGPQPARSGEPRFPRSPAVTEGRPQGSPRPVTEDRPSPEDGSGTLHRVEPVAKRPPKPEGPPSGPSTTEDGPGEQATPRSTASLAEPGPAAASPPEAANAPEGASAGLSVVVPRTIPEGLERRQERGPRGGRPPEPPAPTIRVSIGRIEVRANTPPPAPSPRRERAARPAPPPSLDDYLKQRGGGRR